ncbi:DMT family transporter [Halomonas campisalis]|uniref:DMT family transporter n=1 Tax=Billgrantia campisalis TaxID=74661 RepID=A0ABS9P5E6_9GAMM|nr:DMT family transporter [Halomonas campisalis]MCG6656816.1 DMT family transporter [Halomonas campisalis]MDR5862005.1 DMT family transporter [Halomonas campisalis]
MPTGAAYLIVVLVWATTPLAIKWSAEAGAPVGSVMLRMLIAFLAGLLVMAVLQRGAMRYDRAALASYAAAVPGVFGAMALSYHASMTLPSGMLSVMFGMAPLISGLILQALPGAVRLRRWHWIGCALGVVGLAVVFADSLALGGDQLGALAMMLAAVTLFSGSGIAVQRVAAGLRPLQQTLGALALSLPCFLMLWLASGEPAAVPLTTRGLWAVFYLALFGSLLGFLCYFLILSRLPAATVALVTLITPILALGLGMTLNQEQPSASMLAGAGLILVALGAYLFGDRLTRLKAAGEAARADLEQRR